MNIENMKRTFVRFGNIPVGNSKNHLTGDLEKGISVYDAVIDGNEIQIIFPNLTYSSCVSLSGVLDRPAYEVSGKIVGRGSDGEPLLSDIQILRQITHRAADELQAACFTSQNVDNVSYNKGKD